MKIIPIIAEAGNHNDCRLFTVSYTSKEGNPEYDDEFDRLYEEWSDPVFLTNFFIENETDLQNAFQDGFFFTNDIEKAVESCMNSATKFFDNLLDLSESNQGFISFSTLFQCLHDCEYEFYNYQKLKAKESCLRIYAVQVGDSPKEGLVITGGAIKLTRSNQQAPHTMLELEKISEVRTFLEEHGISNLSKLNNHSQHEK